ncbi:MAG: NADP-dependent isocitrate dehydrogenase [Bacteroidetes bacterium]|jgi:isocitrate dehydrogenase|nr:NADP-dependent isocitrate dehydrogenase [Bacteroidota bacterium]
MKKNITVAYGDGIGPEIMKATLKIIEAAGAQLDIDEIKIGKEVYKEGHSSGIAPEAWDTIHKNKVLLKAPITTPQGGGYKSLNVTLRKSLGLFASVRPCVSFSPYVRAVHPDVDITIVRENEEDLYAGIEHQQTPDVHQCLKLITKGGSEKIIRYAFEYAKSCGRRKVTCMTKDNIMKITDGLFHSVFDEVSKEYPEIESEHYIIDIGAARIASRPTDFDVIVAPNLYGDIISDIAAEITGSVGLGGSENIGDEFSMFEAVHGSAPDIAGEGIANPSGLLLGACRMLLHIGQGAVAQKVENAWRCALEEGIHTGDIYKKGSSKQLVNTAEFTEAVIERLGKEPSHLRPVNYEGFDPHIEVNIKPNFPNEKIYVGVDVFIQATKAEFQDMTKKLEEASGEDFRFKMVTNRGVKAYPGELPRTYITDHQRCRFVSQSGGEVKPRQILDLQGRILDKGLDIIKTENLCEFDGKRAYSLGQGE